MAAVGATDVGQRNHNEDAFLIDTRLGLVLVADGVGGHQAGEVASAITGEVIAREVAAGASLEAAIRSANQEVMAAVDQGRGKAGMASTVVVVRCTGPDYQIAWVGDSRAYLWDGHLKLLTQDHSYVQALLAQGQITLAEARDHPHKNVIVQALGLQDDDQLQVDANRGYLGAGQLLLLCSDGLSDVVDSATIADILSGDEPLQDCCEALVSAAVETGGKDNISVVLVAGLAQDEAGAGAQPEVFWSYDPASGEYSGLPEVESPAVGVRRVAPKGGAAQSVAVTKVMAALEIIDQRRVASRELQQGGRRLVLWWVLAAVVAAGLVYSLGIQGIQGTG